MKIFHYVLNQNVGSVLKHYRSLLDKDLDEIFHNFSTLKRIVSQVYGLVNFQKTDQVKAWKKVLKTKSGSLYMRICSLHLKKMIILYQVRNSCLCYISLLNGTTLLQYDTRI